MVAGQLLIYRRHLPVLIGTAEVFVIQFKIIGNTDLFWTAFQAVSAAGTGDGGGTADQPGCPF